MRSRPAFALSPSHALLAQALGVAVLSATGPALAEAVPDRDDAEAMDRITVEDHAPLSLPTSAKYTRPLLDTPQTISVVNKETMSAQNLLALRDVLSTLPGITFGAGEGGGGFGDSVNLRGFSANTDITVDGFRDSAQYSRSDSFNLEAVEVINGANSVYSGAGAVGGTINLVSKVAGEGDDRRYTAGIGSDRYARATADINEQFSAGAAFRLNLMSHRNDAPGRDVETFERWGVAPTLTLGLDSDTQATLSYLHQRDDNTPQYGLPFFNGEVLAGVDRGDYFGYRNVDRQDIEVDQFTVRVEHSFDDGLRLRNQTRQSEVLQSTVVDPPQGTFCLANNLTPLGTSCTVSFNTGVSDPAPYPVTVPAGFYLPTGPRGNRRDTENALLVNQTDLIANFTTGSIEHDAVLGAAISHERFDLLTGSVLRNPGSLQNLQLPFMDISNPDSRYNGPINYLPTSRQAGEVDNRALYAFDTLALSPQWELNIGARYERNEGRHRTDTINAAGAVTPGVELHNDDDLLSYRGGLVYKPVEQASVYLAFGNSETPSKNSVNGACTAQTCAVDPEAAVSTELGVKWDLYDSRLALTAALSRNQRQNYKVADPGNPDNPSGIQQLDGEARVDALLLGASGLITERWAVYANYSYLDSEVLQGVSDRQVDQGLDYSRGDRLLQVPEHAFNLWTTYDIGSQWQLGYGVTHQGRIWLTQHAATNVDGPLITADGYTVHRLAATYRVSRALSLQLNANNLLDAEYETRVRNNGWATPGDARQLTLTANLDF